ncbi:PepSY domain-containing protein [Thalassotalea fusca]
MRIISSIILGGMLLGQPTALAYSDNAYGNVKLQKAAYFQGSALKVTSAQQAAQIVKQRYGGKVLKVQRKQLNGNTGYRVKLLKANGQVVSVTVDAATGRISGRK